MRPALTHPFPPRLAPRTAAGATAGAAPGVVPGALPGAVPGVVPRAATRAAPSATAGTAPTPQRRLRAVLPACGWLALLAALAALAAPAQAQSVCASEGVPQPVAVLERFISADCERCWQDAATPRAGAGELALDWILPGERGEDAPLSMGASRDGLQRLEALRRKPPREADALRAAVGRSGQRLRLAQGEPVNDYIGTSIELRPGSGGPWAAWLLLVEQLPAGAEGSPVARNLVRNSFRLPWDERPVARPVRGMLAEARPMWIPPGTQPERLRLVALLHDARGRIVAAAQTRCQPG